MIALAQPGVDGILGSPDIIEDLLLLDALHDKIVIGSMNRGGLSGATWEIDDAFTGYDAESIEAMNLDGGKMLLRLVYDDPGTLETIKASANAITALARRKRLAMLEVLPASRDANGVLTISKNPDAMIKAIGVGSALGVSSAYTWLKIHVVEEMERVMCATTLPTLLLGGDPGVRAAELFAGWRRALAIPQVRGLVAGRALLFPAHGDGVRAVSAAAESVPGPCPAPGVRPRLRPRRAQPPRPGRALELKQTKHHGPVRGDSSPRTARSSSRRSTRARAGRGAPRDQRRAGGS